MINVSFKNILLGLSIKNNSRFSKISFVLILNNWPKRLFIFWIYVHIYIIYFLYKIVQSKSCQKRLLIVWMEYSIVKHLEPPYITFLEQPIVTSKELTFLYIEIWVH